MRIRSLAAFGVSLSMVTTLAGAQTAATFIGQLSRPGTGDDSRARLELRHLTNKSFRPGAESERASQEGALIQGLSTRAEWEVRSFLLDELALLGKGAAVAPVSAYLSDADLCEPASLALRAMALTEGPDKALPFLRPALAAAKGKCRVSVVNALGDLRDTAAATVDALLGDGASPDRDLRAVALRALARSGDVKARTLLAQSLEASDAFERNRAVSLNLQLALRLAERGRKEEGIQIAGAVKSLGSAEGRKHVVTHADSTLARIGRTVTIAQGPVNGRDGRAPAGFRSGHSLDVLDLRGRIVRRLGGEDAGSMRAPLSGLPPGIYHLRPAGGTVEATRSVLVP